MNAAASRVRDHGHRILLVWRRPLSRLAPGAATRRAPRRRHITLGLAALVGVVTGGAVAAFDWMAEDLLAFILDQPPAVQAVAPLAGLALAAASLRWLAGGATPATADEFIRNFHDPTRRLDLRALPGRFIAAVATLGLGGAMGYEGPAMYTGAGIGSAVQRRLSHLFGFDEAKVLMVAGAAAGVAAIFKAPVTGLVFAMEVPYQEDLARHMILPAGLASAAGYVTFAAMAGTEPLLPVSGAPPFDLRDLGGAAVIGLVAGAGARLATAVFAFAKRLSRRGHPAVRIAAAGTLLAALFATGRALGIENPTLGPGYDTLEWALEPDRAVLAVMALAGLRLLATAATLGGGGTGGLFIPLVVEGALVGRVVEVLVDPANHTLFPVLGIASFLGAGYRTPLAAVVFVAEFTGHPGFVVPGLIASMVAQVPMGRASVSAYQVTARTGHLERRLALPVAHVVDTATTTTPPDATVTELFWQHLVGARQRSVAVVDGSRYLGMALAEELATLPEEEWPATPVARIARTDLPTVGLDSHLDEVLRIMDEASVDRLAVLDDGLFVGVISVDDVVRLDDVIDRASHGRSTTG